MPLQELEQYLISGEIRLAGYPLHDPRIVEAGLGIIVEVFVVLTDVEEAVFLDPHRLVHLEVKTDGWHRFCVFSILPHNIPGTKKPHTQYAECPGDETASMRKMR